MPSTQHSPSSRPATGRATPSRRRRIFQTVAGAVLAPLGLLWALQGADIVRIEPIGCVANCEPITGGSLPWLTAGVVSLLAGLWLLRIGTRRHPSR